MTHRVTYTSTGVVQAKNPERIKMDRNIPNPIIFDGNTSSGNDVTFSGKLNLTKEQRNLLLKLIEEQITNLQLHYNNVQAHQGWIGKSWNWIKNTTGFGAGSNKAQNAINNLKEKLAIAKSSPEKIEDIFREITGTELTEETLQKFATGELQVKDCEKVIKYEQGQGMAKGLFATIATIGTITAITALGIVGTPFTGGMSLAASCTALTAILGTGAAVSVAVNASDALTSEAKNYTLKQAGKDAISGSVDGALTVATMGVGNAVARGTQIAANSARFAKFGQVLIKPTAQHTLIGTATGAVFGGGGAATEYLLNANEYNINDFLKTTGKGSLTGATFGGVSGGIGSKFAVVNEYAARNASKLDSRIFAKTITGTTKATTIAATGFLGGGVSSELGYLIDANEVTANGMWEAFTEGGQGGAAMTLGFAAVDTAIMSTPRAKNIAMEKQVNSVLEMWGIEQEQKVTTEKSIKDRPSLDLIDKITKLPENHDNVFYCNILDKQAKTKAVQAQVGEYLDSLLKNISGKTLGDGSKIIPEGDYILPDGTLIARKYSGKEKMIIDPKTGWGAVDFSPNQDILFWIKDRDGVQHLLPCMSRENRAKAKQLCDYMATQTEIPRNEIDKAQSKKLAETNYKKQINERRIIIDGIQLTEGKCTKENIEMLKLLFKKWTMSYKNMYGRERTLNFFINNIENLDYQNLEIHLKHIKTCISLISNGIDSSEYFSSKKGAEAFEILQNVIPLDPPPQFINDKISPLACALQFFTPDEVLKMKERNLLKDVRIYDYNSNDRLQNLLKMSDNDFKIYRQKVKETIAKTGKTYEQLKKQLSNSKFIFNYPDMADFIFEDTISAQIEIAKYIEEKNFSYGVISISHELKDIFKDTNINNIEIQKSIIDYIAALPKDYDFFFHDITPEAALFYKQTGIVIPGELFDKFKTFEIHNLSYKQRKDLLEMIKSTIKNITTPELKKEFQEKAHILEKSIESAIEPIQVSSKANNSFWNNLLTTADKNIGHVIKNLDFVIEKHCKEGLPLEFSRADFVKELKSKLKSLPESQQAQVLKKLDITLDNDSYEGFIKLNGLDSKIAEELEIKKLCEKFLLENRINTGDAKIDKFLNSIINGMPELVNIIGKKQHGIQQYTLDIHTLKVLKEVVSHPKFETLSDQAKMIAQLMALFHDIGKKEGIVDSGHEFTSAIMTNDILGKINLPEFTKKRLIELIKNHNWLQLMNERQINAEEAAIKFRNLEDVTIAEIFAEADLKGVGQEFYAQYSDDLKTNIEAMRTAIDELYSTGNILFPTRILNLDKIPVVEYNGQKYRVLNLSKLPEGTDLRKFGLSVKDIKDLRFLFHKGDFETMQTLTKAFNDSLICATMISPDKKATFCGSNVGMLLDAPNSNVINSTPYNQNSRGQKGFIDVVDFSSKLSSFRTFQRDIFLKELSKKYNIKQSDYAEIYRQMVDKKYLTRVHDITISGLTIKAEDLINAYNAVENGIMMNSTSEHNEINLYNPQVKGAILIGNSLSEIPQDTLKYIQEHNLPIFIMGSK